LALNIKADGLRRQLADALERFGIVNYFVFDMSIPDTLHYARAGDSFAIRRSEYESDESLYAQAGWVWLDAFNADWCDNAQIKRWLADGKRVAIVSSELHGRPHEALWAKLMPIQADHNLYLCTDFVEQAMECFDVLKD
jgi:hypothetical protein